MCNLMKTFEERGFIYNQLRIGGPNEVKKVVYVFTNSTAHAECDTLLIP